MPPGRFEQGPISKSVLVKRKETMIAVFHEAHYISEVPAPLWRQEEVADGLTRRPLRFFIDHFSH
jgi:hypothetical protein